MNTLVKNYIKNIIKESFIEELVTLFENIEGINAGAIRANGYGAKPKIEVSRFDDQKVADAILALCNRVAKI